MKFWIKHVVADGQPMRSSCHRMERTEEGEGVEEGEEGVQVEGSGRGGPRRVSVVSTRESPAGDASGVGEALSVESVVEGREGGSRCRVELREVSDSSLRPSRRQRGRGHRRVVAGAMAEHLGKGKKVGGERQRVNGEG